MSNNNPKTWRFYAGGFIIDHPLLYDSGYVVINPEIEQELNAQGSLKFTIANTHPQYSLIKQIGTIVTAYNGTDEVFRGRVLDTTRDFYNNIEVYCEGQLAFLCDSLMQPFAFKGSVTEFMTVLINNHNSQVDATRQFQLGNVTVTDPDDNGVLVRSSDSALTTWEIVNSRLLDMLGGYLFVRKSGSDYYIDYLADIAMVDSATQTIKFGENLLDLEEYISADDVVTCLMPFGAKIEEDGTNANDYDTYQEEPEDSGTTLWHGNRVTIRSVNGGALSIMDASGVALWGKIWGTEVWDDVTEPANLLKKAKAWLADKIKSSTTMTLTAVDLHLVDVDIERINLGDYVKVYSKPHSLNRYMSCISLHIEPKHPDNSTITLGATAQTLTRSLTGGQGLNTRITALEGDSAYLADQVGQNTHSISNSRKALETLESKVSKIEADQITTENLEAVNAKITNLEAADVTITGNLDAATARIDVLESDYVKTTDLEAKYATIENLDATNANITTLTAEKANVADLNAANAEITNLKTDKLDVSAASATYATIENLNTTNANIDTLTAEDVTINGKLDAQQATIDSLDSKYANIDFANVEVVSAGELYAKSGIIADMTVENGVVTGTLASVTINADLINTGTLSTDRLLVKGENGLYYKLNVDALGETTAKADEKYQNGLDGSMIIAKSIVATKIDVSDLVAFDATIGGFHITEDAIYSGAKAGVDNTTSGSYLDSSGQVNFGDATNYLKYYDTGETQGTGEWGYTSETISELPSDASSTSYNRRTFDSSTGYFSLSNGTSYGTRTTAYYAATEDDRYVSKSKSGKIYEKQTSLLGAVTYTVYTAYEKTEPVYALDVRANKIVLSSGKTVEETINEKVIEWSADVDLSDYITTTQLTVATDTIKSEVSETYISKTDAEETYATKSEVTQTADNLTSTIGSVSDVANANIKSSQTLFYASNATTAPSKPTAQVTLSNTSTRGAWNLSCPTYSGAYPYLYTCQQLLTSGGDYSWTEVSQSSYASNISAIDETASSAASSADTARTEAAKAQSAADAGIKSQITLFYASAESDAASISKPTAAITIADDVTGAWTQALPSYDATAPYLYTCQQLLTNGGDHSWTEVAVSAYSDYIDGAYSQITQLKSSIKLTVTDGTTAGTAQIKLSVDNTDKGSGSIDVVSLINASADTIKLSAGRLIIDSGNFRLDAEGNCATDAVHTNTLELIPDDPRNESSITLYGVTDLPGDTLSDEELEAWKESHRLPMLMLGVTNYETGEGIATPFIHALNCFQIRTSKSDILTDEDYIPLSIWQNSVSLNNTTVQGALEAKSTATVAGTLTASQAANVGGELTVNGALSAKGGQIELYGTSTVATPYIDFHYGGSTDDYTSRIIESSNGTLELVAKLLVDKGVTVGSTSGGNINIHPSTSTSSEEKYISMPTCGSTSRTMRLYGGTTSSTSTFGLRDTSSSREVWYYNASGNTFTIVPTLSSSSDRNLKEDISEIPFDLVDRLKPAQFRWKGTDDRRVSYGFIAQDVESALESYDAEESSLVSYETDENGEKTNYTLSYQQLIPFLVKKCQSLQAQVDALTARLDALEKGRR